MFLTPPHAGQWLVTQPVHLSSFPCQEESPGKPVVGSRCTPPPIRTHFIKSMGASKRLAYAPILSSASFITEGTNPPSNAFPPFWKMCFLRSANNRDKDSFSRSHGNDFLFEPSFPSEQCSWNAYLLVTVDICHRWVSSVLPFLSVTPVGPPA